MRKLYITSTFLILLIIGCTHEEFNISKSDLILNHKITEFTKINSSSPTLGEETFLEYHDKNFVIGIQQLFNDSSFIPIDKSDFEFKFYKIDSVSEKNEYKVLVIQIEKNPNFEIVIPFVIEFNKKYELLEFYEGIEKDEMIIFNSPKQIKQSKSITFGQFEFYKILNEDGVIEQVDSTFSYKDINLDFYPRIVDQLIVYHKTGWILVHYK